MHCFKYWLMSLNNKHFAKYRHKKKKKQAHGFFFSSTPTNYTIKDNHWHCFSLFFLRRRSVLKFICNYYYLNNNMYVNRTKAMLVKCYMNFVSLNKTDLNVNKSKNLKIGFHEYVFFFHFQESWDNSKIYSG